MQNLPELVDRAVSALQEAKTHAEILGAKDMAGAVYTMAKGAARLAKANHAHDHVIKGAHEAQGRSLEVIAAAKSRLSEEYETAQKAGEVATVGQPSIVRDGNNKPTTKDIGISRKDVHEGRMLRAAERAEPGIIRRTIKASLSDKDGPSKAKLRRAVVEAASAAMKGGGRKRKSNRNPLYVKQTPADKAWTHVYGTCRAFAEWATTANIKLAMEGRSARDDSQRANVGEIRKCIKALERIMEKIDA